MQEQSNSADVAHIAPPTYQQSQYVQPVQQPGYQGQPGCHGYQTYPGFNGLGQQQIVQPGYGTVSQTVVTMPPSAVIGSYMAPPPDRGTLAWMTCLFCFWPLGLVSILKNNEARNAVARGDYNAAHTYANEARSYALLSIGIGSGLFVLYLVVLILLTV